MAKGFARNRYCTLFWLIIASLCAPAIAGASGNLDKPFLGSSISSTSPFVGQEILLTYTLYFRNAAPKISSETNPSLQGLWAKESVPDRFIKSIPTIIQGEHFRSAIVKQFRLVPIQSGSITVSGYNMQCVLPQQQVTTNGDKLPDTPVKITAPAIIISAHALPEPVPEGFSGAVGDFSLTVLTDKQNLRIGEPLSVKLTLAGTGSLLTLELPALNLPESFRQNPPDRTTTLKKESALSSGSITSTIIAWPQSEGDFHIPSLSLVVFNPETRQFSTLLSKPLAITVTGAVQGAMSNEKEPFDTTRGTKRAFSPLLMNTAIIIVLLLCGVAIVVARKKQLQKRAMAELDSAEKVRPDSGNSAGKMKQQLFSVLEEAGIKSPGGLTRRELTQALLEINITDETRKELPTVLDALDMIIYCPAGKKEAEIPEWVPARVTVVLNELKKAGGAR
ncbi:MAG: BatD family protein [Chlorobiaceae bacterium]